MMTAKVSTTDTYGLAPLKAWESAVMDIAFLCLPMYGKNFDWL